MELSQHLKEVIDKAACIALHDRAESLCPEHLLLALLMDHRFASAVLPSRRTALDIFGQLKTYLESVQRVSQQQQEYELTGSEQMNELMTHAYQTALGASARTVDITHVISSLANMKNSMASKLLVSAFSGDRNALIGHVAATYAEDEAQQQEEEPQAEAQVEVTAQPAPWTQFVLCMNDLAEQHPPLVGRKEELEHVLQTLCRQTYNNPLLVGERGVGKSSLAWGVVQRILSGRVPRRLRGARVYALELGTLLVGTQYRGEVENRLRCVMEGLMHEEGCAILYIDDLGTLASHNGDGNGMDPMLFLRPWLETCHIPVMGSATPGEVEHLLNHRRGISRMFHHIEVSEPSAAETQQMLEQLAFIFEQFHRITFAPGVLAETIALSQRYMKGRHLPEKALDLLDDAASYRELHPRRGGNVVDAALVKRMVARRTKLKADVLKREDNCLLQTLTQRVGAQIYGQDEAVRQVVQSVELAKAGLLEDDKPMASLLFVGPTGVGKTEVARVLAKELGVELVRFDMSEYTESHTVAKLIGSPAGYIGYEDGGLLTDAIRRNPNCVLLLDEIEKAHQTVYNILLQVMDYASLTDNRGQKADFRNVVIIMTSNAGAQYASQAAVGFTGGVSKGEAMLAQLKKTFKPEFLNRLSATVVFRDMDRAMATQILGKKLRQLQDKLKVRGVQLTLSREAREWLLQQGYSPQYGAREMDRTLRQHLTPLCMNEILYGSLLQGGKAKAVLRNGVLALTVS